MSVLLVEGWTEPIRDALLSDGIAQDLTGMTVELVAYQGTTLQTFLGVAAIDTAISGIVSFTPDPTDLVKGRLKIRWKVTDGTGHVAFFPNAIQPEIWIISKA